MNNIVTCTFSNEGPRNEVRKRVVLKFLEEQKGLGKKEQASNYTYFVENLSSGQRIFLKRPAWNYYGFDFIVNVEGYVFSNNKSYPKHTDILEDLTNKKQSSPEMFQNLLGKIIDVYNCKEIQDDINSEISFNHGYKADMLLKTIKWFFIEQDVRYWNYSGRDMLMKEIDKI